MLIVWDRCFHQSIGFGWMQESTAGADQLADEAGATQWHAKLQHARPSHQFFFHSRLQCESFAPPFSSAYLTLSSVCSSCCDHRASRFHRRFIRQPAQQGTRCGKGKRWRTCARDSATPQKVSRSVALARAETVVPATGSMSCKVAQITVWFHAGGPCRVQDKGRDALWVEGNPSLFRASAVWASCDNWQEEFENKHITRCHVAIQTSAFTLFSLTVSCL